MRPEFRRPPARRLTSASTVLATLVLTGATLLATERAPKGDPQRDGVAPPVQAPAATTRRAAQAEPLDVFRVSAIPIGSFGLGLRVLARLGTGQIARVIVKDVAPGSDAAVNGMTAGDEIVRVDGRPIVTFAAGFDRSQEFGRLFIGRAYGDRITLEYVSPSGKRHIATLTEGISAASLMPWQRPQE